MIEPVAPAKTVQPAAPLLEERHGGAERLQRLDAVARVVAPPRMRPAGVALLAAGAERDDLGAALRPARAFQRDVERKQDLVEGALASETPLAARHRARDLAGDVALRAAEAFRIGRRDVDGDVRPAARPPVDATPSWPSGPRVSGRIASGPASPASPVPPFISGK